MKRVLFAVALVAAGLSLPLASQAARIGIAIGIGAPVAVVPVAPVAVVEPAPVMVPAAPPVPVVEAPPPPPAPGYAWTPGYWSWNGASYIWVPGAYAVAQPGAYWVPARYVPVGASFGFVAGHWGR